MPLYGELIKTARRQGPGRAIYAQARPFYHPIAVESVDKLVGRPAEAGRPTRRRRLADGRPVLIPATVIGSWSFPGWYEKFIARRRGRIPTGSAPSTARRRCATPSAWPSTTSSAPGSTASPTARCSGSISTSASTTTSTGSSRCRRPAAGGPRRTTSASQYRCVGPLSAPRGLGLVDGIPPAPRADRRPGQGARPRPVHPGRLHRRRRRLPRPQRRRPRP